MATLNEQLTELQTARDNIKTALEGKGQIVNKDIRTYAVAITNIITSGSGTGIKQINNLEELNQQEGTEGDIAVVYKYEEEYWTETTRGLEVTFPYKVVLDTAITTSGSVMFMNDDELFGALPVLRYSPTKVTLESDMGWGDDPYVKYVSEDGITYIRESMCCENPYTFSEPLHIYSGWTDLIQKFLTIPKPIFKGLFQYNSATNSWINLVTGLTACSDFVTHGNFMGKDGVEEGTASNFNVTNLDALGNKSLAYSAVKDMYLTINYTDGIRNLFSNQFSNITHIPSLYCNTAWSTQALARNCHNLLTVGDLHFEGYYNTASDVSQYMFMNCENLLTVGNINIIEPSWVNNTFSNCVNLHTVGNINIYNTITTQGFFSNCQNLKNVGTISLTNKTTRTAYMFYNCVNLVDAPMFDNFFPNLNDQSTYYMFAKCKNLVNVPQYNMQTYNMANMIFSECNKLSDASVQNIINMCLNSTIGNATHANLSNAYRYSIFYNTNIDNSRYQNRWEELTAAGWSY